MSWWRVRPFLDMTTGGDYAALLCFRSADVDSVALQNDHSCGQAHVGHAPATLESELIRYLHFNL